MNTFKITFYFILGTFFLLPFDVESLNTTNEDPGWEYIWIYSDIGVVDESKNIGINCLNIRVREFNDDSHQKITNEYSTQTALYKGKNGKAKIRFSNENQKNVFAEISIEKLDGTKLKTITLPTDSRKFRIDDDFELEDASSLCRETPMYSDINKDKQNTKEGKVISKDEEYIETETPIQNPEPYYQDDDTRFADAEKQELAEAVAGRLEIELGLKGDSIKRYQYLMDSLALNETNLIDSLNKTKVTSDSLESVIKDKDTAVNYLASLAIPKIPFLDIELMRKVKDNYKRAKSMEDLAMFSITDNELLFENKDHVYCIVLANLNGTIVMLHEAKLLPLEEILIYKPEFVGDKKIDDLYFKFYFKNSFGEKETYKEIASGGVAVGVNNKLADSTIRCTMRSEEHLKKSEWISLNSILKKYVKQ